MRYTYDGLARLTEVHRFNSSLVEDTCERETYFYDSNPFDGSYSQYVLGRLAAVQYMGGGGFGGFGGFGNCGTTFTEMYTYSQAGARVGKRLRIQRQAGRSAPYNDVVTVTQDLNSTYAYDNEGRMTSQQYPLSGPNLGYAYDTMGRLNTMTDVGASSTIISGSTYGPAGQLLSMSGQVNETRTYNALLQLTQLSSLNYQGTPQLNITYAYPATQNMGKISSQTDNLSGEQIVYAYDNMNRLATAQATNNSWGQSYTYDGFGNLTDQNVIAGSAPTMHVVASAATNRIVGGNYDANGNDLSQGYYDFENRLVAVSGGSWQYSYAPGNKRVWRGVWTSGTQTTDEVTFWGVTGQKLATYSITMTPYGVNPPVMTVAQTATNYYFGGKMIKGAGGYVFPDRLGSIGKYYPYGQEKPSATANGKEKFATYFRDLETGADYADQRYHLPGTGRFLTPDPSGDNWDPSDPLSWNMYSYSEGDPVNYIDPTGLTPCKEGTIGINGPTVGSFIDSTSDLGILTETIFTESAGTARGQGPAEMGAIGAVILNRWQILNGYFWLYDASGNLIRPSPDWGPPSASLAQVMQNPNNFAVWTSDGTLSVSAQANLDAALNSDFKSDSCNALVNALGTASQYLDAKSNHQLYTANDLVLTSFNSFKSPHASSTWEQRVGTFGSANVFYGIPFDQTRYLLAPVPLPPRPARRPGAGSRSRRKRPLEVTGADD